MDTNNDIEILNTERKEEVIDVSPENKEPLNINPTLNNNGPSNNFDNNILEINNKPNNTKIIIPIVVILGVIFIFILAFAKKSIYGTYVKSDSPGTAITILKGGDCRIKLEREANQKTDIDAEDCTWSRVKNRITIKFKLVAHTSFRDLRVPGTFKGTITGKKIKLDQGAVYVRK